MKFISKIQDHEEVKRICDVYDWHGKGQLDMYYFMDIFYAIGMNITKKVCVKFGQTDDVEKKYCKFDEVIALMEQAVKEPEHSGNYHDFVELCLLYDKNENGTMMLAELDTFLNLLGEMFKSVFTLKLGKKNPVSSDSIFQIGELEKSSADR